MNISLPLWDIYFGLLKVRSRSEFERKKYKK